MSYSGVWVRAQCSAYRRSWIRSRAFRSAVRIVSKIRLYLVQASNFVIKRPQHKLIWMWASELPLFTPTGRHFSEISLWLMKPSVSRDHSEWTTPTGMVRLDDTLLTQFTANTVLPSPFSTLSVHQYLQMEENNPTSLSREKVNRSELIKAALVFTSRPIQSSCGV